MTEDDIIQGVIEREGEYVDDPDDGGGPTKFGIILKTLSRWRGHACTADDVKALDVDEARAIYRSEFVHRPGFDLIPHDGLRVLLVDTGVQWNPQRATAMLQEVVGAHVDGVLGPATLSAIATYGYERAGVGLGLARIQARGRRITDKPSQAKFAAGWANRDVELLKTLLG